MEPAQELRALIQSFVRDFGLMAESRTPCGHPISPSSAHALMILLETERSGLRLSQSELARILGINKSNLTRLSQALQAQGRIEQVGDPDDERKKSLALTAKGRKLAGELERSSLARFRRLLELMPPHEHKKILSALAHLNHAVRALENEPSP